MRSVADATAERNGYSGATETNGSASGEKWKCDAGGYAHAILRCAIDQVE
jgi:hypothetical protein